MPAEALERLAGCDLILHAGDLHTVEVLDQLEAIAPTVVSRGNGDVPHGTAARPGVADDPRVRDAHVLDAEGVRIGLTHDLQHLEGCSDDAVRVALDKRFGGPVDIAVCGHTHIPMVWGLGDGTALMNPGSASMPYGYLGLLGTVALIRVSGRSFAIDVVDLGTGESQLRLEGPASHVYAVGPRPVGGH
jgi:putative phosphoesterase